jgi:hypothetical protein
MRLVMQEVENLNVRGTIAPIANVVVYAWPWKCPMAVSQTHAAILTRSDGDRTSSFWTQKTSDLLRRDLLW